MKWMMFSVLDAKAAVFGRPFFEQTEGSAIRVFSDAVNDGSNPNNLWNKHPEDFSLYKVGEFDDYTAEMIPEEKLKCLVTASGVTILAKVEVEEKKSKVKMQPA